MNRTDILITVAFSTIILSLSSCSSEMASKSSVLSAVIPSSASAAKNADLDKPSQEVTLMTDDGLRIASSLYRTGSPFGVILVHQMAMDRSSYDFLVKDLTKKYDVIAIDLRGHGKSQGDRDKFETRDYQSMINDLSAAAKELGKDDMAVIGASIGANHALGLAVMDPRIKTAILLSPGLDYHQVKIEALAKTVSVPVLAIAARNDDYSVQAVNTIASINPKIEAKIYGGSPHGTEIFKENPGMKADILAWLKINLG